MPKEKRSKTRPSAGRADLAAGRDALLACITACEEIAGLFQHQNAELIVELICVHLSHVYKTLQGGWLPIVMCWPRVAQLDQSTNIHADLNRADEWTRFAGAEWATLRNLFWFISCRCGLAKSALEVWTSWVETYTPTLTGTTLSRQELVERVNQLKRVIGSMDLTGWSTRKEPVKLIEMATQQPSSPKRIKHPGLPPPFRPLPESRVELTRLLQRADQYADDIVALLAQWQMEVSNSKFGEFDPGWTREMARLHVLYSEFVSYLDPIGDALQTARLGAAEEEKDAAVQEIEAALQAARSQGRVNAALPTTDRLRRAWIETLEVRRLQAESVRALSDRIRSKLRQAEGESTTPSRDDKTWISASEAAVFAGWSLTKLSRLCGGGKPPFRFRKPSKNRLEIHFPSFALYLLALSSSPPDEQEVEERKEQVRKKKPQGEQS